MEVPDSTTSVLRNGEGVLIEFNGIVEKEWLKYSVQEVGHSSLFDQVGLNFFFYIDNFRESGFGKERFIKGSTLEGDVCIWDDEDVSIPKIDLLAHNDLLLIRLKASGHHDCYDDLFKVQKRLLKKIVNCPYCNSKISLKNIFGNSNIRSVNSRVNKCKNCQKEYRLRWDLSAGPNERLFFTSKLLESRKFPHLDRVLRSV